MDRSKFRDSHYCRKNGIIDGSFRGIRATFTLPYEIRYIQREMRYMKSKETWEIDGRGRAIKGTGGKTKWLCAEECAERRKYFFARTAVTLGVAAVGISGGLYLAAESKNPWAYAAAILVPNAISFIEGRRR